MTTKKNPNSLEMMLEMLGDWMVRSGCDRFSYDPGSVMITEPNLGSVMITEPRFSYDN